MARGWESKSVEGQQAEALGPKQHTGKRLSPEQQALRRQIDGLKLSRKNILHHLESATHARHREMLEESLAELERQIRELDKK
jgi:hypothetical protein